MDRRRRKTRDAIIAAFTRLFFEIGYDAVTIGKVAAAADVGRSTFYTHFRRKEELLRASMTHLLETLADAVSAGEGEALPALMDHFWENRRHRQIFSPGSCRAVLGEALAELIEKRLADSSAFSAARVPGSLAARLIADHQLSLIHHWLTGHHAVAAPAMSWALRDSSRSLCLALRAP